MSSTIGRYRPLYPLAGKLAEKISRYPLKAIGAWLKFYSFESRFASKKGQQMQERLKRGETLYLLGLGPSGHNMNFWHFTGALKAPAQLVHFFGTKRRIPIIGMRHHNNHAYYPYAMSPFSGSKDPTIIIVPQTLELLNAQVKYRERIRPLAPIVTLEHAKRFFHLSEGASDDNYFAYNYMILTAQAKKVSYKLIPSVIHKDGTSRIQICRQDTDPVSYAILKAMKKYLGVELAVNTSLNVGTPIVHSPSQAINAMHRSKGLTGLLMIEENGNVYLTWHNIIKPPKDGGQKLMQYLHNNCRNLVIQKQ